MDVHVLSLDNQAFILLSFLDKNTYEPTYVFPESEPEEEKDSKCNTTNVHVLCSVF